MIPHAPPSFTAISNGRRATSRKGAFIHLRVDRVALELGIVADEVLGGHRDPVRLHTPDEPGGDLAGEQWILAVALEVPTTLR
jgi:hypothetical protein